MAAAHKHTIHDHQHHFGWDNSLKPILTVGSGETVYLNCKDSSGGQITPEWTAKDVPNLDFSKVNPTLGPIAIDGAEPGDAIKVTLVDFIPCGWGWTANIPGFGLLADQFKEPAINIWKYDANSLAPAMFGPAKVPLKPFAGTIGLAPAEPGHHSVVPPRRVGGNMDIRDLAKGSELYLPVEVKGALFSLGDTHAAQGDGEDAVREGFEGDVSAVTFHGRAHVFLQHGDDHLVLLGVRLGVRDRAFVRIGEALRRGVGQHHAAVGIEIFLDVLAQFHLQHVPVDAVVIGHRQEIPADEHTGNERQVEHFRGERRHRLGLFRRGEFHQASFRHQCAARDKAHAGGVRRGLGVYRDEGMFGSGLHGTTKVEVQNLR